MLSPGEMLKRLRNSRDDLDWMLSNSKRKRVNLLAQLRRQGFDAQTFECLAERVGKAANAVSVRLDRFPLDFVEPLPDLLRREFAMVEERDEVCNRTLEVDVVLPER